MIKIQKYRDNIIPALADIMIPLNISAAKWRILAIYGIICLVGLHHIASHICYIFY